MGGRNVKAPKSPTIKYYILPSMSSLTPQYGSLVPHKVLYTFPLFLVTYMSRPIPHFQTPPTYNSKVLSFTFVSVLFLGRGKRAVEASRTRGTTALVYCLTNSSLYTGTVHRWWRTSNWPDGHQGCRQVSTGLPPSSGLGWEEKRSEVQHLWRCPLMGWVPHLWHL